MRRESSGDHTSNSQVSMHQCHPWIGNADMHSTRGFITESQSHTYYIEMSQKRTYYNKYGLRPSKIDNSERLER